VIRDAVIHMQGEQPLLADLPALPSSGDACLVCTNLRTMDGKRPVFIDASQNTFVIPILHIRFIEIVDRGGATPTPEAAAATETPEVLGLPAGREEKEEDVEIDEDFLRRIREV
jgi:hypothetical protein